MSTFTFHEDISLSRFAHAIILDNWEINLF